MRRSLLSILLITMLIVGLGLGEMAWTRLSASGCLMWQGELQRRVESYARLHLPDPAPQVQVQSTCGHPFVADALYFRWHKFLWRMGWRDAKPLDDGDLRMAATRDLMQHPDMGTVKFVVRFDAALSRDIRKKVEAVLSHYLSVSEPRQRLEFKRLKKLPESPAAPGSLLALERPSTPVRSFHPPLFPAPESPLRLAALKSGNSIIALVLVCLGGFFLLQILVSSLRPRKKPIVSKGTPVQETANFGILVAPRVILDWGERGREIWRLLLHLDARRAAHRVRHYWEKDREGLLQFLGWLDAGTQESLLNFLETDQLLQLTDIKNPLVQPRDLQRAGLRILLDLARELGQCSQLGSAPLFLQLMTRREWQRVAQQLTRPRRRALAELLDKERASCLRGRQDLHPGWFHGGAKETTTLDQIFRRVRAILQADADQLREHLYADRAALQVIDSYFADLTLDTTLNSDLMMLMLGECLQRHAGFGRLVERQDPNLSVALAHCEDQQVALLLLDCDAGLKDQILASLGARAGVVRILLRALEVDKAHSKSLRMQARSLQRFMERQVLVAELLCARAQGDQKARESSVT